MKCNWKQRIVTGTMVAAVMAGNMVPAMASAAPDGKTDAEQLAATMNLSNLWESWKSEWNTVKTDWTQISLTPGSDASQLNFAWYSVKPGTDEAEEVAADEAPEDKIAAKVASIDPQAAEETAPKLIIGEGRSMRNAQVYVAAQTDATEDTENGISYLSNKVTATGLKENTTYYYSYEQEDGTYTTPEEYETKSTDSFRFIYVGDPQIGSSNEHKGDGSPEFLQAQSDSVCSDAFNWETTLNSAVDMAEGEASFVLSAGDQIQMTVAKSPNKSPATSEIEYAGYLSPDILKSLPVATTVGNHDADNPNYTYHFNTPNNSELGSNQIVGGDYWFTYGSALFMMLNTQDTNVAEHKQFIEEAVAANPDCKWRIVTLHQDIYGSAEHSNEPEITNLRYSLVPYFEENDVDVVLTGHDHAYSRSQILLGGEKTVEYTDDEFDEQFEKDVDAGEDPDTLYVAPGNIQADTTDEAELAYLNYLESVMDADAVQDIEGSDEIAINPEGILYMTANSSSGSKYYDLVSRMQTYLASRWQEDVPTYSVVDVTDETFTISTYRTDNNEKIDETFTIAKVKTDLSTAEVSSVKNQVYTGERITPAVTVTADGKTLTEGVDYTVSYKNNKYTGKATITLTGIGNYTGTKTTTFKIVPKQASIKSATSTKKKTAVIKMNAAAGKISGFEVKYATNSSFKNAKTKVTASSSRTLTSLTSGKTYYVKVRAYKYIDGKRTYGAYSKTVKVKVK